jgi:asparagine synthase (glutamine-hydrolysing)
MSFSGRTTASAPVAHPASSSLSGDVGLATTLNTATPVASIDGAMCIALGSPRFSDPEMAATAAARGPEAAWDQAFRRHGALAPQQASGRFAVVWVDNTHGLAFLATDRFGTWPVCYALEDGGLAFADRADAVPVNRRALSTQALFSYLYFHCIPSPETIFEGVRRLPAGHTLQWQPGRVGCVPHWQPTFDETTRPDFTASQRQFLDIVQRNVAAEADGQAVGAFLSGGTDSSTVSGMLCKTLGRPAKTYSIGFDASGYDEMAYARIAARHFGTEHHEYYVTPDDLLAGIPLVAAHYDQPFGNSSAVPAWVCASRAKQDGVDKLLAGDGGDELFGGNVRYAKQQVFGIYDQVPALLRSGLIEPVLSLPGAGRLPPLRKGRSYVEQARVPMPDRMQMYNLLHRLGVDEVFERSFLAAIDQGAPLKAQREVWQESAGARSQVNRMLAFDWKYTLADNDLPKVIGTTALAGVDVGFPLLADELLDFSLALPPQWKLKGLTLRWFFKEALRGFLPAEIITKQKHGFGLPFGVWACQHPGLNRLASDALGSLQQRGIVRPAFLDALLRIHLPAHPGYYGEMVWILMMLEFWLQRHAPDWRHATG